RQQREFTPDDHNLLQIFADQASFILQETWLLRRYKKVAHIGQEINQELATIDELFQKLKTHVASILDTSHALVLSVYQPQSNTFNLYMQEGKDFIQQEHMLSQGACQHAIKIPQTIFIEHLYVQAKDLPFQIVHIPGTGPKESFIFVPLTLRDEPLGVLSIQHPEPHAYTQEDRSILELLANHIALALHNIRMDRSLNQLNEIDEILTQQLDSEQTLQAVVDKIRDATKADLVVLYPFDSTRNSFIFPPRIAGDLLDSTSSESIVPNQPGSGAKQILRRAKPIFAQHDSTHLRQGSIGQREQIRSTVAIPLRVGEEAVGLLFVNFRQLQHFDTMQKLFLESLAHYAAIAIKNAQTFGTLSQRRVQEMVIFQHIDRQLSRTLLDLNSFLNTLLKLVQEYVAADEATILLYNPQLQALEAAAAIGPHADVK
ncbi:MAG TPA: GAF domain-containing protein, partial [Ktedonobacteraceae bacterium]|nr:GAF domain-containing protein [Ktedonobacteraceae bacterium]